MNRIFGTKKKPAPEVKAPSLSETSEKVLSQSKVDGRKRQSNTS